jgi:hypothetical protein
MSNPDVSNEVKVWRSPYLFEAIFTILWTELADAFHLRAPGHAHLDFGMVWSDTVSYKTERYGQTFVHIYNCVTMLFHYPSSGVEACWPGSDDSQMEGSVLGRSTAVGSTKHIFTKSMSTNRLRLITQPIQAAFANIGGSSSEMHWMLMK